MHEPDKAPGGRASNRLSLARPHVCRLLHQKPRDLKTPHRRGLDQRTIPVTVDIRPLFQNLFDPLQIPGIRRRPQIVIQTRQILTYSPPGKPF